MKNKLSFDGFMHTLSDTNRCLDFFVDWEKCLDRRDEVAISLNHLNFLLGKEEVEMQEGISTLFRKMPEAFEVLPSLKKPDFVSTDSKFSLYQGDYNLLLPKMEKSFDLIFADPPYFLSNDGLTIQNGGNRECQ